MQPHHTQVSTPTVINDVASPSLNKNVRSQGNRMLPNFKKPDAEPAKSGALTPQLSPLPPPLGSQLGGQSSPPSTSGQSATRPSAPSVIGPDLIITGNLISKGEVQIDGEVQGDIHSSYVVVGEKARITGGIIADEVVVRGQVMGSIRGKRVMLQSSSHVEGDIHHSALAIEQGAFFEGKSRRSDDPTAGVQRPDVSRPGLPNLS
jgi:cytoskeletal protein CcmA (bactofilin family)